MYGLPGMDGRVPTFLVNVNGVAAEDVAAKLAASGQIVARRDAVLEMFVDPMKAGPLARTRRRLVQAADL